MKKYFFEMKTRLLLLSITFISTFFLSYYYKETLLFLMMQSNLISFSNFDINFSYFIFTDVTEILFVYLKLVVFITFQIVFFFIYLHIFFFLSPALFYLEYIYFKFYFKLFFFLWMVLSVIIFYLIIPLTWNFFLNFQKLTIAHSFHLHFETKLIEYFLFHLKFYSLSTTYAQSLICILFLLQSTNLWMLQKYRKFYHFIFIFFTILLDPTEFFFQIVTYIFLVLVYELLIISLLLKTLTRQSVKTYKKTCCKNEVS